MSECFAEQGQWETAVPTVGLVQCSSGAGCVGTLGCLAAVIELASCERMVPIPDCVFIVAFVLDVLNLLKPPKSPRCIHSHCLCPFRCKYILLKLPALCMIFTPVLLTTINSFLLQI